jgi:hypothetical protein
MHLGHSIDSSRGNLLEVSLLTGTHVVSSDVPFRARQFETPSWGEVDVEMISKFNKNRHSTPGFINTKFSTVSIPDPVLQFL